MKQAWTLLILASILFLYTNDAFGSLSGNQTFYISKTGSYVIKAFVKPGTIIKNQKIYGYRETFEKQYRINSGKTNALSSTHFKTPIALSEFNQFNLFYKTRSPLKLDISFMLDTNGDGKEDRVLHVSNSDKKNAINPSSQKNKLLEEVMSNISVKKRNFPYLVKLSLGLKSDKTWVYEPIGCDANFLREDRHIKIAVKYTKPKEQHPHVIFSRRLDVDLKKYPYISFDYKVDDPLSQAYEVVLRVDYNNNGRFDDYITSTFVPDTPDGTFVLNALELAMSKKGNAKHYRLVELGIYPRPNPSGKIIHEKEYVYSLKDLTIFDLVGDRVEKETGFKEVKEGISPSGEQFINLDLLSVFKDNGQNLSDAKVLGLSITAKNNDIYEANSILLKGFVFYKEDKRPVPSFVYDFMSDAGQTSKPGGIHHGQEHLFATNATRLLWPHNLMGSSYACDKTRLTITKLLSKVALQQGQHIMVANKSSTLTKVLDKTNDSSQPEINIWLRQRDKHLRVKLPYGETPIYKFIKENIKDYSDWYIEKIQLIYNLPDLKDTQTAGKTWCDIIKTQAQQSTVISQRPLHFPDLFIPDIYLINVSKGSLKNYIKTGFSPRVTEKWDSYKIEGDSSLLYKERVGDYSKISFTLGGVFNGRIVFKKQLNNDLPGKIEMILKTNNMDKQIIRGEIKLSRYRSIEILPKIDDLDGGLYKVSFVVPHTAPLDLLLLKRYRPKDFKIYISSNSDFPIHFTWTIKGIYAHTDRFDRVQKQIYNEPILFTPWKAYPLPNGIDLPGILKNGGWITLDRTNLKAGSYRFYINSHTYLDIEKILIEE